MTKKDLINFLKPFTDNIELKVETETGGVEDIVFASYITTRGPNKPAYIILNSVKKGQK